MSDRRSIFAGFGTASMLSGAVLCVLLIGTAVIGYNGWPGHLVGDPGDDSQIAIAGDGARATRIAAERISTVGEAAAAPSASAAATGAGPAAPAAGSDALIGAAGGSTQSDEPADLRAVAPAAAGSSPQATAAPGDQLQPSSTGSGGPALVGLPTLPGGDAAPDLARGVGESVKQAGSGLAGAVGGGRLGDVATSTTTVLGDTVIDLGDGLDAGDPPSP